MAKFSANATIITEPIADDHFMMTRDSNATNKRLSKAGFDAYVLAIAVGEWTPLTVTTLGSTAIPLGAVATYQYWSVKAFIINSTDRYKIEMEFVYDGTTGKFIPKSGLGTIDALINFKQSSVIAGQFYWDIYNGTGNTITVKYKIIEKI